MIILELNIFQNKLFIKNENIITDIYRIHVYDSIMCGYFCIGFIDFMLKGKNLHYRIHNYLLLTNIKSVGNKYEKFKNAKIQYI